MDGAPYRKTVTWTDVWRIRNEYGAIPNPARLHWEDETLHGLCVQLEELFAQIHKIDEQIEKVAIERGYVEVPNLKCGQGVTEQPTSREPVAIGPAGLEPATKEL